MGAKIETYCDGCGKNVGEARIGWDVIQITAFGTNGQPAQILLCIDPNLEDLDLERNPQANAMPPKVRGCAKKVLTKSVLATLYQEVAEYTGDDTLQPFLI